MKSELHEQDLELISAGKEKMAQLGPLIPSLWNIFFPPAPAPAPPKRTRTAGVACQGGTCKV
jgi:hypothetical protein